MIQADPKKTIVPMVGVAIAALLLWVWDPNGKAAEKTYFEHSDLVFGTYYNIRYEATENLEPAIQEALTDFDNSLSMFNPHSIISAINANRDTTTNEAFETMFTEATRVHELSGGAFDITVAPLVNYWGFGSSGSAPGYAQQSAIDSLLSFVGFDKVQLIDHHILKSDPRVMLDAGAVAKGQACDMVAQVLRERGCENYLVEIGGEVVAHGVNAKAQPWAIGINKPNLNNEGVQDEYQDILRLTDACLATSGNYRNFRTDEQGLAIYGHTIDPRIGQPVQRSVYSATVISSSCMRADALATACMVLGAEEALDMIDRAGDAACLLIVAQKDSLSVITSSNWEKMSAK